MAHTIVGGKPVRIGMRVFTNDWRWGTVLNTEHNRVMMSTPHVAESEHADTCTAWFDVELDMDETHGSVTRRYDCTRMADRQPRG